MDVLDTVDVEVTAETATSQPDVISLMMVVMMMGLMSSLSNQMEGLT